MQNTTGVQPPASASSRSQPFISTRDRRPPPIAIDNPTGLPALHDAGTPSQTQPIQTQPTSTGLPTTTDLQVTRTPTLSADINLAEPSFNPTPTALAVCSSLPTPTINDSPCSNSVESPRPGSVPSRLLPPPTSAVVVTRLSQRSVNSTLSDVLTPTGDTHIPTPSETTTSSLTSSSGSSRSSSFSSPPSSRSATPNSATSHPPASATPEILPPGSSFTQPPRMGSTPR